MLSIAHLSDAQRMFFVTTLLSEVLAWMRTQSGTSSLRALVYMDEIFGYFPPSAAPPSKLPMLTLLKQARAFGVGVLLATQNPVDLDYKGLANAGTWFIGRLQTERDKLRVLDGLQGAMDAASHAFDRQEMDRLLSGLGSRVFLLNDVHEDAPELFQTRWTLSYLRGPLDKEQIQMLSRGPARRGRRRPRLRRAPRRAPPDPSAAGRRPVLPAGISEGFLPATAGAGALSYRPAILGQARLHYVDKKSAVDAWESVALLAPVDGSSVQWDEAQELPGDAGSRLGSAPAEGATFEEAPAAVTNAGAWNEWKKSLAAALYQSRPLKLFRCDALDAVSTPGESLAEFKARLTHSGREQRDADVEALRRRWAPKLQTLQNAVQRAQKALADQQSQASGQTLDTVVTVGTTLLGAFLGRKTVSVTNLNRARTALRSGSRTVKERQDVGTATQQLESAKKQLADAEAEFGEETEKLQASAAPEALAMVEFTISAAQVGHRGGEPAPRLESLALRRRRHPGARVGPGLSARPRCRPSEVSNASDATPRIGSQTPRTTGIPPFRSGCTRSGSRPPAVPNGRGQCRARPGSVHGRACRSPLGPKAHRLPSAPGDRQQDELFIRCKHGGDELLAGFNSTI